MLHGQGSGQEKVREACFKVKENKIETEKINN